LVAPVIIDRYTGPVCTDDQPDLVAVEEPLEIRLGFGGRQNRQQRALAVMMRTPGTGSAEYDQELALGFLFTEGIIHHRTDILSCRHCVQDATKQGNVIRVELAEDVVVDWARLERNVYTASSCGICGKASIEAVQALTPGPLPGGLYVEPTMIQALPDKLRTFQKTFAYTGGLHAAALFDASGQILMVREDIGRHNALDKIIGAAFWQQLLPLHQCGILVSGRVAFELVQKCWMAGVPLLAAVGAPSSLAVETARQANITLLGFVRDGRYNSYNEQLSMNSQQ
jgi:FdhD protein